MKLSNVLIENYRSIAHAELPIDTCLTTLVGANEHGKTNLLWAIRLLDFKTPILNSDKRVPNSDTSDDAPTHVTCLFKLDEGERDSLTSSIQEKISANQEAPAAQVNVRAITSFNLDGTNYDAGANFDLLEAKANELAAAGTVEILSTNTQEVEGTAETISDINIPETIELRISYHDGTTNTYIISNEDLQDIVKNSLLEHLKASLEEKIFYFDTFNDKLKHQITKDEIIEKKDDITNGLIKLSGLTGKESLIFEDTSNARQQLRTGERALTKQLQSLWVQGKEDKIKARLHISNDGNYLNVDIEDCNTYGDISTRSRGFLFFLSFILKFKEYHDGDLKDFIFLIDEPGIFLHPRGQKDLLLYIEGLADHNQIAYTTHSPFMINRITNYRIRVVSKDKESGTQIDIKPFIHNWKSLRVSLGMMLADSFYYADKNLIVEGSSDRLFILTLLRLFTEKGIENLDLNILSIIDSGGCSNVPTMVQIVNSEERPFTVLVDSDNQGNNAKESILKKRVDSSAVKQIGDFMSGALTIEDVLPRKYYLLAVNASINELVSDGVLGQPDAEFRSTAKTGVAQKLDEYLTEKCRVKGISKLSIARHFEETLSGLTNEQFDEKDFIHCRALVSWIGKELNLVAS